MIIHYQSMDGAFKHSIKLIHLVNAHVKALCMSLLYGCHINNYRCTQNNSHYASIDVIDNFVRDAQATSIVNRT